MWSALEFFATAQSCRELSVSVDGAVADSVDVQAYKNDVHLLPTELDEKVAKLRLPALGTVHTVFGEETKNSSCVELECGTTPLVRDDCARSHLVSAQLG